MPGVVYQAGFFDGEFLGYADFVERGDDGWVVCDAKLAREAHAKALLQLAAYADQLDRADLPVAPTVVSAARRRRRRVLPARRRPAGLPGAGETDCGD